VILVGEVAVKLPVVHGVEDELQVQIHDTETALATGEVRVIGEGF
jgi:hypothetical protein